MTAFCMLLKESMLIGNLISIFLETGMTISDDINQDYSMGKDLTCQSKQLKKGTFDPIYFMV